MASTAGRWSQGDGEAEMWKAIGVLGIADALWLAADPKGWSRFWVRNVKKARKRPLYHWSFTALELGMSAWMLRPRRALQP